MFMSVLDLWVVASDRLGESTMNAREKRGRGEGERGGKYTRLTAHLADVFLCHSNEAHSPHAHPIHTTHATDTTDLPNTRMFIVSLSLS